MKDIRDTFKQLSEDEKLRIQVATKPTRGIYLIDVGNATEEVALESIRQLREKYNEDIKGT